MLPKRFEESRRKCDSCEECRELKAKVKEFGRQYLDCLYNYDEVLKELSKNKDWDMEADAVIDFLTSHKNLFSLNT